jgi:hypothetical protein
MSSITPQEISIPEIATSHSRREALKRFGRYAAAAPAVMVLLEPSVGHAGKGKGRGWGKGGRWGKGGGSHY